MRVGRRRREGAEVEASSMNDIMFFLMLFFLIASTLANPNVINIMLPKASTTTHMEIKTLPVTVKIENKGSLDAEELGIYIEQERVAFDDLDDRLLAEKEKAGVGDDGKSLLNVVLRLDKDLKVQDMVDVMQVGANLGIKMVLATDKTRS
ncbi:biopolymer transporter ExbD [Bacteroidota bacterium]|nr:biopolymer transporter ExbD [Flavobacteriaceae bacterium]PHX76815.1 MAG: biopolymer transporter ExbD [Flavobacteriales bacterium]GDX50474.1 biopolymer transporter ExbD [Bacteroidota bacterium]